MTTGIQAVDVERFRAAVVYRLGLYLDEGKLGFLAEVLRRRLEATGHDSDGYLARLESPSARDEIGALARELTVPETYFFRNVDQYRAFVEVVLPERAALVAVERRLRILSLGCASGEETYSLAMLARDTLTDPGLDLSILGVDVNPAMIEKAGRGRFSAWALRETPEADQQRWFRRQGREFVLDDALRASVRFEERNLVEDDPQFWQNEMYDVVFCRNVLMYFAPEQAQAVVGRIARALRPGGYLFLGHAETLRGLSNAFHLRHTHNTFYYQRKERGAPLSPTSRMSEWRRPPIASLAAAASDADTWVDAIRRASERVAALTEPRPAEPSEYQANAEPVGRAWDLGGVVELLRQERFAEALAIVNALPPDSSRDPDVLLLRAVLLVHGGQLVKAEDACRRLLESDELSAGAHYLLALCREGGGDRARASYHDQVAAYLDPGFAMPRLHLGLLARRAGDRAAARRELGHALVLLQREDASRVLLFGGGFGREALTALCRTELTRCGGNP
ncbi:MAG: CheR family methyltransferase, partial [Vicinamibacterales bacterium]